MGKKSKGRQCGRSCRVCGDHRPNEAFGGKGVAALVCKRCRRQGKDVVGYGLDEDFFDHLFEQKNVSEKNLAFLRRVAHNRQHPLAARARFALRVVQVAPRRRVRQRTLVREAPELVLIAAEEGWIHEDGWWFMRALHEGNDEPEEIELFDWPAPPPHHETDQPVRYDVAETCGIEHSW